MKQDTYERVLAILEKSQVKPHTRKLKSGAVVQVKGYTDKRTKKAPVQTQPKRKYDDDFHGGIIGRDANFKLNGKQMEDVLICRNPKSPREEVEIFARGGGSSPLYPMAAVTPDKVVKKKYGFPAGVNKNELVSLARKLLSTPTYDEMESPSDKEIARLSENIEEMFLDVQDEYDLDNTDMPTAQRKELEKTYRKMKKILHKSYALEEEEISDAERIKTLKQLKKQAAEVSNAYFS